LPLRRCLLRSAGRCDWRGTCVRRTSRLTSSRLAVPLPVGAGGLFPLATGLPVLFFADVFADVFAERTGFVMAAHSIKWNHDHDTPDPGFSCRCRARAHTSASGGARLCLKRAYASHPVNPPGENQTP
jgi:hypothetical protein